MYLIFFRNDDLRKDGRPQVGSSSQFLPFSFSATSYTVNQLVDVSLEKQPLRL